MNLRRWFVLSMILLGLGTNARAHFLFIRIEPMAEAGRSAEVFFSEQAEAGDPRFVEKVAGTHLWVQSSPGKFTPLVVRQATDRLRAALPATGSVAVIGACEYGVLARPNQTPFLLRYYPKAIAGRPEELNRMVPRDEIPLEIQAKIDAKELTLTVLRKGKPVPGALMTAIDTDLTETKLTTGPDGSVRWSPPAEGHYSVYTRDVTKGPGELAGKSYEEVREFATLAFAWPLARDGADAAAVTLFEGALAARAKWEDFPGFTATVAGAVDGRAFTGRTTFNADGTVDVQTDDPVARPWLEEQLASLAMHRLPESTADASAPPRKPVLRFGDKEEDHPLGRLLLFQGGRFASSYRVKDGQILVVNRHNERRNMTITVLDNERNREGRFLPRSYVVQYWDAGTGKLDRAETIQERWTRIGAWDLPASHTMTTASDAGLSVRNVTFSDHALRKP